MCTAPFFSSSSSTNNGHFHPKGHFFSTNTPLESCLEGMSEGDGCRRIGAIVYSKAIHVTSPAECARRYGARAKTKEIAGVVLGVETVNTGRTPTSRSSTMITVKYKLDSSTAKTKTLNSRSVRLEPIDPQDLQNLAPLDINPPPDAAEDSTNTGIDSNINGDHLVHPPAERNDGLDDASRNIAPNQPVPNVPATASEDVPTVTVNGVDWFKNQITTNCDVGGPLREFDYSIATAIGGTLSRKSDICMSYSRLDYFLMMFPPQELAHITAMTSHELISTAKAPTTRGEILKFFGVIILITKFEFARRSSLWATATLNKYEPLAGLRRIMTRERFNDLWAAIRFSYQPAVRPEGMSSEHYRWMLVDDFVTNFNDHRSASFKPSSRICVDESMSRWYGLGGEWINTGLPMYVAIDRKPENGCEIQDAACGKSGIMIRLKLVKTSVEEQANRIEDNTPGLHGTRVLLDLVRPWAHSNRLVCADSYFASVGAAMALKNIGLRFIGVVKTATKMFPNTYLSNLELENRGDRQGLFSRDASGTPELLAFVWMDRDRRYFIASASSLEEGAAYARDRWRQVDTTINASPQRVQLTVPQPKACELYYSTCAAVDQHNRDRQATLQIEKKLLTKDWSQRVNLSILGICIVDTWKAWNLTTGNYDLGDKRVLQKEFYSSLSEELIDNKYDVGIGGNGSRRAGLSDDSSPLVDRATGRTRAGISIHLTPTKRMRVVNGIVTKYAMQQRCSVCSKKTKHLCSGCVDNAQGNEKLVKWVCHTNTKRDCFRIHMQAAHDM